MATTTSHLTQANIDALNELAADTEFMHQLADHAPADLFDKIIQAEYTAYLCTFADHASGSLALGFDEWKATVLPCTHPNELGRIACGWGHCTDCGSALRTANGRTPELDVNGQFMYAVNGDMSRDFQA